MMRKFLWTRAFKSTSPRLGRGANAREEALRRWVLLWVCFGFAFYPEHSCAAQTVATAPAGTREFVVKGVVKKVEPESARVIVAHETIPNFMGEMTMPFRVKDPGVLAAIQAGDSVSF